VLPALTPVAAAVRSHRRWRSRLAGLVAGAALLLSTGAHAGMFDDDEARQAILDLRAKVEQEQQQNKELRAGQDQLRQSLLDLNNQIEQLRGEIARLRGTGEQLGRDVSDLQRRQKDIAQGVDERVRKLEPQRVSIDGKEFAAEPDEKRAYEEAIASFRSGDFAATSASLNNALGRWPSSGYADSALFWLGNAQYGLRQYKEAIASFRKFAASAPTHPRAPEAWLSIANCYAEIKDKAAARKAIDELIRNYPDSEAAATGRERLASLR
jgi:tol-pal system protein YbgF